MTPLTPANAVREITRRAHKAAQERLADQGIRFYDAELAYRYELARADLRDWETLGDLACAADSRLQLDELTQMDADAHREQVRTSWGDESETPEQHICNDHDDEGVCQGGCWYWEAREEREQLWTLILAEPSAQHVQEGY